MKTFLRAAAFVAVAAVGLGSKPAEAQVSVGIATPGFALGVGPGAGFIGGGVYPGYPAYGGVGVVAAPVIVPRPIYGPGPIYGRPYYGGGYGYGYGRPGYYGGRPGYGYPGRHYR